MTSTTTTGAGYTAEPGSLYASLVSYWKLDETSDGSGDVTRVDSVGTHNLTDTNTVLHSTSGKIGNCADIEKGNTESLVRANASAAALLGASGSWTFSCWVNPESLSNNDRLVSVWATMGSANRGWRIVVKNSNELRLQASQSGSGGTITTCAPAAGQSTSTWYHFIVQHRNGTDVRLKVDDAAWVATSLTGGIEASNQDFSLGHSFDGLIDEAAFWSKAITDEECSWLYNGGYGLSLY
jgi:hypothetical protein